MKKTAVLLLVFAFITSAYGCAKSKIHDAENENVAITIPSVLTQDPSAAEIEKEAEEMGFIKCAAAKDGEIAYEMSSSTAAEVKWSFQTEAEEKLAALKKAVKERNEGSIEKVEINQDYSEFKVFVNPDQFQEKEVIGFYPTALASAYYQAFS
ncbi:MAG: hypothetical protein HUJ54_08290, partial [Erysipelotrichaceae bacterium]|nr:hypothetical protein [Erysipelotrichaceae bacterium]